MNCLLPNQRLIDLKAIQAGTMEGWPGGSGARSASARFFPGTTFISRVSGFQKGVAAMAPQQKQNMSPDIELNLALAVVASSAAPLLLLDGDLTLVAVSDSFCRAFEIDPGSVPGSISKARQKESL